MAKGKNWVNFAEIKSKVRIEDVIDRYGLADQFKKSGKNIVGCCPIHKGSNSRQFSIDPDKNIWNCFGNCKTGGNILDFVAMMEFGNKEMESIRKAALLIKDWFLAETPEPKTEEPKLVRGENKEPESSDKKAVVNPPLSFELKSLDPNHAFFEQRGILPETVKHFGLGFCKKGMMANRIAIPIHNINGELVAYCGRAVTNDQIKNEGKYKLPPKFVKQEVVYNLHRQPEQTDTLILTESYISVWWLSQAGYSHSAALMGSVLGKSQEKTILGLLGPSGKVILMFDADEDGRKCTLDCLKRLIQKIFVKYVNVGVYAKKPHQLKPEQLKLLLG